MADSDNTTTLSRVTRLQQRSKPSDKHRDPAVDLFLEWRIGQHVSKVLCRHQQRLEKRVNGEQGFLGHVPIEVPLSNGEIHTVQMRSELEDLLQSEVLEVHDYAEAERKFVQQVVQWNAADRRVGYSLVREAEAAAATAALRLQDAIPNTVAQSLQGIVAKLEMIVGADREIDDPTEFPWPHLNSVLRDLKEIVGAVANQRPERTSVRAEAERCLMSANLLLGARSAYQAES